MTTSEPPRPQIGSIDVCEPIVGLRGHGKSNLTVNRVLALQRRTGAYMIGHSPGARLPEQFFGIDGRKHDSKITWHADIKSLDSALEDEPGRFHVVAKGTADELIQYGRALSIRCRRRAAEDVGREFSATLPMTGVPCEPVIIAVDEGVALRAAKSKKVEFWFEEFLFGLRHEHTALIYSIQNPNARNWLILDQATRIWVFRVRHLWSRSCLEAAGMSKEEVREAARLPKYKFIEFGDVRAPTKEDDSEG